MEYKKNLKRQSVSYIAQRVSPLSESHCYSKSSWISQNQFSTYTPIKKLFYKTMLELSMEISSRLGHVVISNFLLWASSFLLSVSYMEWLWDEMLF